MNDELLSKERVILRTLRKVLAEIVKDATPPPGMPHPFRETTIHDIRELFRLIAEREAELAAQAGLSRNERPYYADQPRQSAVITVQPTAKDAKLRGE